jgi:non-specific serine/threonine protein kinase
MKVNDLVLGKYRIIKVVSGEGLEKSGMSNLYKAQDKDLGTYWAIKEIMRNSDGTISLQQASLVKEAQIMRKLQHMSIPRIVSIEYLPDRIIIVMDWADGRSVGEWIRSSGAMPMQRGINIVKTVCSVLGYLHSRQPAIFYRDMKPENIMFDPSSKKVMLLDFGISVEVDPTQPIPDSVGTKGYYDKYSIKPTSSEIKAGVGPRYFDLRSDIYSLGWTMFEIFTGVHPLNYVASKQKRVLDALLVAIQNRIPVDEVSKTGLQKKLRKPLEVLVKGGDVRNFVPKVVKAVESVIYSYEHQGISNEEGVVTTLDKETIKGYKNSVKGIEKEVYAIVDSLKGTYEVTRDVREYAKNIPQSLADVIIKATEPELEDRFQSIEELQLALEDLDKVEMGYNKMLRKRVNRVVTLGVVGVGLCLASIAPYMSYEQGLKNQYRVLVANASKSGEFSDYLKVIEYSPKEIDPYFGIIDAIKQDGVFTKEEETQFLDLLNPSLSLLEKSPRFKELAFEVGRLYWLYYNDESSQEVASRWFKDAKGYSDLADVYSSIGSFPTEVVKAANEGTDAGMYKKQWNLLDSVSGQSELVALHIAKARVELVNNYPYRLKADGVSKDEILSKLNEITSLIQKSQEREGRQADVAKELSSSLEKAKKVVEVTYNV